MTAQPSLTHRIAAIRLPTVRSGRPALIDCTCGASMEAMPDLVFADPHQPIVEAWLAHRRAVGAGQAERTGGDGHAAMYAFGRTPIRA